MPNFQPPSGIKIRRIRPQEIKLRADPEVRFP